MWEGHKSLAGGAEDRLAGHSKPYRLSSEIHT